MSKRALMLMSIVLLVVLSISFYNQHKKKEELYNYRKAFISCLNSEISRCIYSLQEINSEDEKAQQSSFKAFSYRLSVVDQVIRDANHFMDRNIRYDICSGFNYASLTINGWIPIDNGDYSGGFLEDRKLSEEEIAFLTSLKEDLEKIKNKISYGEKKQPNYKLTIKEINEIISPFYDKYTLGKMDLSDGMQKHSK